jgi:hypothetical protein
MAALSRDNSVASSIDGMQPPLGKARHLSIDSAPGSPGGAAAAHSPAGAPRLLNRTSSVFGREAAAAAGMNLAEAAVRALGDGQAASMGSPEPLHLNSLCSISAADCHQYSMMSPVASRPMPQSPLHARMTCMKLRDGD